MGEGTEAHVEGSPTYFVLIFFSIAFMKFKLTYQQVQKDAQLANPAA